MMILQSAFMKNQKKDIEFGGILWYHIPYIKSLWTNTILEFVHKEMCVTLKVNTNYFVF